MGEWSDPRLGNWKDRVLGNSAIQSGDVKTQSSFSRSGESCILLQVKDLPFKVISSRSWAWSQCWKVSCCCYPSGLLLSSGALIRLKSPKSIQYCIWVESKSASQEMKPFMSSLCTGTLSFLWHYYHCNSCLCVDLQVQVYSTNKWWTNLSKFSRMLINPKRRDM
jgi:hypothetical protein